MATQKEQQERVSDIAQIDSQRAELSAKIQAVLSELGEIGRGIESAERNKAEAKAGYSKSLDAGNEDLMREALSRIRKANSQRQSLTDSLTGFSETISVLRQSYEALLAKARACRAESETALDVCRTEYKNAELLQDRCAGLFSRFNELDEILLKTRDCLAGGVSSGASTV